MINITSKTIQITGPDTLTFLQGFVTCDINELENTPRFTACCNQKGRIIANFWAWLESENCYFLLPENMTETLINHLKKYRFRSKVEFNITEQAPPSEPDFPIIWIYPETTEQFTPQMINLEKNGGVSFKKGCYLGQEIIARTEHLGKLKRHLYTLTCDKKINPNIGEHINNAEQQKVGTIVAIDNDIIFAVLEDRAIDAPMFYRDDEVQLSA